MAAAPLSPGAPDGPHLPAFPSAAIELIAAIALQAGDADAGRHIELLQNLSRLRIDPPQIAFVTFQSAVPKLSIKPGNPGDEAAALDSAKNHSSVGIDLMNLPVPILAHP